MEHMEIQVPKERVIRLLEKLKAQGLLDTPAKENTEGTAIHSAALPDLSKLREMASWLEAAVAAEGDTIKLNIGELNQYVTALRDSPNNQRNETKD